MYLYLCIFSKNKSISFINIIIQSIVFLFIILIVFGVLQEVQEIGKFQGLLIWIAPISLLFLTKKSLSKASIDQWALGLIFVIFPYFYVFGTISNYWVCASFAGIFWLLFGLIFFIPTINNVRQYILIFSIIFLSQIVVVFLLLLGINYPYRQAQPLYKNNTFVQYGTGNSTFILSESFQTSLKTIFQETKKANFKKGTLIIDLTGQSPGIVYALNGMSVGLPWFLGGYPGSNRLAEEALKKVSCEALSKSWVLFEAEGPRNLSPMVLEIFGANFFKDYEIVATWKTAEGMGGFNQERVQQLLRPIRSHSQATQTCEIIRK